MDEYKRDSRAIQKIADQKYTFENLYNNLNEYKEDSNVLFAMDCMQQVLAVFNQIQGIKEPVKTTRDEENKLIIDGGTKLNITENQFNELKQVINQLRKQIITNPT